MTNLTEHKICITCNVRKPLKDFYKKSQSNACKSCRREQANTAYAKRDESKFQGNHYSQEVESRLAEADLDMVIEIEDTRRAGTRNALAVKNLGPHGIDELILKATTFVNQELERIGR